MNHHASIGVRALALALCLAPPHTLARPPEKTENIEVIEVTARPAENRFDLASPDAAEQLAVLPGVAVNRNGALTGLVQYRGLFGPRMSVRVDGHTMISGGPNWMDPPFHYVPAGLLHSATLEPGPSGTAAGPGMAGLVHASLKRPAFAGEDDWTPYLDLDASARSIDEGFNSAGTFGIANARQRIYVSASSEDGDDYEAGGDRVVSTAYEREAFGVGYGWRSDRHSVEMGWRRVRSDDSGTPALPLDIEFFDTELWHLDARTALDLETPTTLTFFAGGSDVQHAMNNTDQRPTPDFSSLPLPPFQGPDARRVRASAEGLEFRIGVEQRRSYGFVEAGLGWREETHDAVVRDPDFAPFFVTNFDDARYQTATAHLSLRPDLGEGWRVGGGVRYSHATTDADAVDAFPARLVDANPAMWPMGTPPRAVFALRERFNARDREQDDHLVDADLTLSRSLDAGPIFTATLARRSRAPAYLERYLWIPLEVNAGLGDGNNYVGDPDLDPEVSHQIELALSGAQESARWSVRGHFRRVDDFIHGIAETDTVTVAVSGAANGDATPLRFANREARIWGIEGHYARLLTGGFDVEVNAHWLDGELTDANDHLFRIAPPELDVMLGWTRGAWFLSARQRIVAGALGRSETLTLDPDNARNRFETVDAFAVTDLAVRWQPSAAVTVRAGIENLFDAEYEEATAGFTHTASAGASLGRRLPGRGRGLYAGINYRLGATAPARLLR